MKEYIILTLLILFSFFGFSQDIKSITEFKKVGDSLIKKSYTEFDENKNQIRKVNFRNRSNRIVTTQFKKGKKVSQVSCDYFKKQDTCVMRSFSKFKYNKENGIETQTLYESDSLIRFIREKHKYKRMKISKTYSWEFSPTKSPDFEKASIYNDTIFYNKKNQKIKRVTYNSRDKNPNVELYNYNSKKRIKRKRRYFSSRNY